MEIIDFKNRSIQKKSEQNASRSNQTTPSPFPEPNESLILALKDLLSLAEKGELQSLISIGLLSDNAVIDGWYLNPDSPNPYALLGAIEALKQDFIIAAIDSRG